MGQDLIGDGAASRLSAAPVPQYWIADAHLFLANSANCASVMASERVLSIQRPAFFTNQAQILAAMLARARDDIRGLLVNANQANPEAVPAVRDTLAQLTAAGAEARTAMEAAAANRLGPVYLETVTSTLAHLRNAQRSLDRVARSYPGAAEAAAGWPGPPSDRSPQADASAPGRKQPGGGKAPRSRPAGPGAALHAPSGARLPIRWPRRASELWACLLPLVAIGKARAAAAEVSRSAHPGSRGIPERK